MLLGYLGAPVETVEPDGWDVPPLDARFLDDYLALWAEKVEAMRERPVVDEGDWEDFER